MKFSKRLGLILASIFLIFSLVACGNKNDSNELNHSKSNSKTEEKIIDREGNEVSLPKNTEKIVSLAPSITETLINLGLAQNIVAVDTYSLDIEGVNKDIPVFDILNPDSESIVNLNPDIILGTGMAKVDGADPFAPMIEMGTFVSVIPTPSNVEGILEDIAFIGKITKTEEKANKIIESYSSEIEKIINKIEDSGKNEEISVYFETSPAPSAYSFGKNTFLNDMLNLLNAKNIFEEQEGWLSVSEEQILDKNPSVILTNSDYIENPTKEIKERAGWNVIDAIKNDRVYLIPSNASSRANENSIIAFKEMAKALYPDLFNE